MPPVLEHFHTYFLFPFSIDKEVVNRSHRDIWKKHTYWMAGLDEWISNHDGRDGHPLSVLGSWRRAAYTQFDMDSAAYQDMVFFHPFVRRIFFDTVDQRLANQGEFLLRCYRIPLEGKRVWLTGESARGRSARIEVTDLRLFLFANGIGILSLGVEADNIPVSQALWINEMLRKVYPSSGRAGREGRSCSRMALSCQVGDQEQLIVEECFDTGAMVGFQPPLSRLIAALLYFLDYAAREYEQVLDERMIVYSYLSFDPASLPPGYGRSEDYLVLLTRFLYVDQDGPGFRYDPTFTREQLKKHLYTRWAHEGTYYGFTSYSSIAACLGQSDRGDHSAKEGFLIHRMFDSRYYTMAIVALFYRATLLDFAEKTALVSKRLYLDQEHGTIAPANLELANSLRLEFLHFSNYWYFEELANKDEESEHFKMQCGAYEVRDTKSEVEEEIDKLNATLHTYNQKRSTDAVNRLAVMSLILGAGAVVTGFFGMNFGREFAQIFFEPLHPNLGHYGAIAFVVFFSVAALAFAGYLIAVNWSDYRQIVRTQREQPRSSLKLDEFPPPPPPRKSRSAAN